MKTAHLFKAKGGHFILIISADARPIGDEWRLAAKTLRAAKKEAEALCSEYHMQPWNF